MNSPSAVESKRNLRIVDRKYAVLLQFYELPLLVGRRNRGAHLDVFNIRIG